MKLVVLLPALARPLGFLRQRLEAGRGGRDMHGGRRWEAHGPRKKWEVKPSVRVLRSLFSTGKWGVTRLCSREEGTGGACGGRQRASQQEDGAGLSVSGQPQGL